MIGFFNFASAGSTIVISSTQRSKTDAKTPKSQVTTSTQTKQGVNDTISGSPAEVQNNPNSGSSISVSIPGIDASQNVDGSINSNFRIN